MQLKAFSLIEILLVLLVTSLLVNIFSHKVTAAIKYNLLKVEAGNLQRFIERKSLLNFRTSEPEKIIIQTDRLSDHQGQTLMQLKHAKIQSNLTELLFYPDNICSAGSLFLSSDNNLCKLTLSIRCRLSLLC